MSVCLEADDLVFPDQRLIDIEVEARVLSDWLEKGKRLYREKNGEEVNIQGQLLCLLPKLQDVTLKRAVEDILKKSVTKQQ